MSDPWYQQGLKFHCLGCGDCCTGEPGYVWVTKAEIAALAARSLCRSKSSSGNSSDRWACGRACWNGPTATARCSTARPANAAFTRPPAAMPHLALLALEPLFAGGLGDDRRALSRLQPRAASPFGTDSCSDGDGASLTLPLIEIAQSSWSFPLGRPIKRACLRWPRCRCALSMPERPLAAESLNDNCLLGNDLRTFQHTPDGAGCVSSLEICSYSQRSG